MDRNLAGIKRPRLPRDALLVIYLGEDAVSKPGLNGVLFVPVAIENDSEERPRVGQVHARQFLSQFLRVISFFNGANNCGVGASRRRNSNADTRATCQTLRLRLAELLSWSQRSRSQVLVKRF